MSKRDYNVFFHTHTVSGIVISVALYVIFFAGAFALIKDEITAWEKGNPTAVENRADVNYDKVVETIECEGYNLYGRDIRLMPSDVKQEVLVILQGSKDSLATKEDKGRAYFKINTETYETSGYYDYYSMGELLFRLHFFSQIPYIGMYLAGLVAVFFLFAIVTGVVVHWKKIISNFYVFRPAAKLKTVWTDAHTVLGMIGVPFQFVYAVTSCFLGLSILALLPANFLYNGDQEKLMADVLPMMKTYPLEERIEDVPKVNQFMQFTLDKWEGFTAEEVHIKNYGSSNMKFLVEGLIRAEDGFLGKGRIVYEATSGKITSIKDPYESSYMEGVRLVIYRLHFGDYGGLALKMVYFIMAIITCFVIISGVLIWLEARKKRNMPERKRRFNRRVGVIYLALCLSMYPITAISFVVSKLIPEEHNLMRMDILYWTFFGGWLLATVFFILKKDNFYTNKYCLLSGSIVGFFIPISNGISSGNWIWVTYMNHQHEILFIDVFWIVVSVITFITALKVKRKEEPQRKMKKGKISIELDKEKMTIAAMEPAK
ncbi:PepSY-associated TM helix domain-containing protein [Aquimarina hainanensis]|uniref:PepSY-associated TM helix domain-containing protein n=1 Tax=Aquimarina hainanensis TaxID=1578017 RepID=A0ABW5N4H3_9FLAO